jgi:hypothetical protein
VSDENLISQEQDGQLARDILMSALFGLEVNFEVATLCIPLAAQVARVPTQKNSLYLIRYIVKIHLEHYKATYKTIID